MEIKFFPSKTMSFDIFVITYRVTNFLPKLVDMLLFSTEKTEFPFLVFPYFRVMPGMTYTNWWRDRRLDPPSACWSRSFRSPHIWTHSTRFAWIARPDRDKWWCVQNGSKRSRSRSRDTTRVGLPSNLTVTDQNSWIWHLESRLRLLYVGVNQIFLGQVSFCLSVSIHWDGQLFGEHHFWSTAVWVQFHQNAKNLPSEHKSPITLTWCWYRCTKFTINGAKIKLSVRFLLNFPIHRKLSCRHIFFHAMSNGRTPLHRAISTATCRQNIMNNTRGQHRISRLSTEHVNF